MRKIRKLVKPYKKYTPEYFRKLGEGKKEEIEENQYKELYESIMGHFTDEALKGKTNTCFSIANDDENKKYSADVVRRLRETLINLGFVVDTNHNCLFLNYHVSWK